MFKRTLAIAGVIALAGIALGAPASAAPPTPVALTMHSEINFQGEFAAVSEGVIPDANDADPAKRCGAVPLRPRLAGALSAINLTTGTAVTFYSGTTCAAGDKLVTLDPGESEDNLVTAAQSYNGV